MPKQQQMISLSVVKRLPRYRRFLNDLLKAGISRISSKELAHRMNLTASQIRQDLNCFGGFGLQGYGYNVDYLYKEIGRILGIDNLLPVILIGAGNLGKAIALQMDFAANGFVLIGVFDKAADTVGKKIDGTVVSNIDTLEDFCTTHKPSVAILCIPKSQVPLVSDRLVALGIKGFWNFSHYDLISSYDDISVENVHLSDSLMTLAYQVNDARTNSKPPHGDTPTAKQTNKKG